MNIKDVIVGAMVIILVAIALMVGYLVLLEKASPPQTGPPPTFTVLESGAAGNSAYAVLNYRGTGNLTIFSYKEKPQRKIHIINDSQAIETTRLNEFITYLKYLEKYGYSVDVVDSATIGSDIYVVPSGAIPSNVLFNLQHGASNGTIIYIGDAELSLSTGIKRTGWYASLPDSQKKRVVLYNTTLDRMMELGNLTIRDDILSNRWIMAGSSYRLLSGAGTTTISVPIETSSYLSIIYDFGDFAGIFDSSLIHPPIQNIDASPPAVFPGEKSTLEFGLTKTNGTAVLSIYKDSKLMSQKELLRVTDNNVFIERLTFEDPGKYILKVTDNSGVLAGGIYTVKSLEARLVSQKGFTYVFFVTVDGIPVKSAESFVSLGNSSRARYFISDGALKVNAQPSKGPNRFTIWLDDASVPVDITNDQEQFLDFYLKYGGLGALIVLIVYFGARMTRRPTYRIKFGDSTNYIRREITIPKSRALESFKKIREDMAIGNAPISPHEFTISLKRYLTNGADVTEGNVEEILKKLVEDGKLICHRDYYQLSNEGNVKQNTLRRMIKEKLIESGTQFKEVGSKFITKDLELGFFGDTFTKKAIIIVDDSMEAARLLKTLGDRELAKIKILQSNDLLTFVPIDELGDVL